MKPAAFDYARPDSLAEALALLDSDAVKCLAGGQSLGPMLNLRLVRPRLLVDITRIAELGQAGTDGDWLVLGACVTHAAIEDGRVPDLAGGVLAGVARNIAYRAVRTRGTIGGSLAHADPAADWIACLAALGAEVVLDGSDGRRRVPVAELMTGVFETAIKPGEILTAVRIPRLGAEARWGYYKVCRKPGDFAEAIGAVLADPERERCRAVVGATDTVPIVLADASGLFGGDPTPPLAARFDAGQARQLLRAHGLGADAYALQVHAVALERAVQAMS